MLPASNRGIGMSLQFPNVCKAPAPPLPFIPVPLPNMGMNMQAVPFSPFVFVTFIPATNMAALKVMTSGGEPGPMGGLISQVIKGPGKTTMGNPIVFVTGLPSECLATPTNGNLMNAPVGIQCVPSQPIVFYTYRHALEADGAAEGTATEGGILPLDLNTLQMLDDVARGEGDTERAARVEGQWLTSDIAYLRVRLFSSHTDRNVYNTLRALGPKEPRAMILDLRGNPGGDALAAIRLASEYLPSAAAILTQIDNDGDEEAVRTQGPASYGGSLCVLIDEDTASAAELLAASMKHHGRATVIGRPSYGKATAQRVGRSEDGALAYTTVAEYRLPDGSPIEGCGVIPDIEVPVADDAVMPCADDACVRIAVERLGSDLAEPVA